MSGYAIVAFTLFLIVDALFWYKLMSRIEELEDQVAWLSGDDEEDKV